MERPLTSLEAKVCEVLDSQPHSSATEIATTLRRLGVKLNRNNLDRLLPRLVKNGRVRALDGPKGKLFETRLDPHAHLRCWVCGGIQDVPFEPVRHPFFFVSHAERERFVIQDLVFDVYGYCRDCLSPIPNGRPLETSLEAVVDVETGLVVPDGAQVPAIPIVRAYNRATRHERFRALEEFPQAVQRLRAVFEASLPKVKTRKANRRIRFSEDRHMMRAQARLFVDAMRHALAEPDTTKAGNLSELVDVERLSVKVEQRYEYRNCHFCKAKVRILRLKEGYETGWLEVGHLEDCFEAKETLSILGFGKKSSP